MKTLVKTALAVTTTAVLGGLATNSGTDWYTKLNKPSWQPPSAAFGLVWTPLYAVIAYAGARALDRSSGDRRRSIAWSYGVNLTLNAAWPPLFFAAKCPPAALAEIVVLNLSNLDLTRRMWQADPVAGAMMLPYVGWTFFATALNTAIVRLNY